MLDVGSVLILGAELSGKPRVEDFLQQGLGGGAQAEREHVGVVPAPRARGRDGVGAKRRPHSGHLVGGDRRTGARPAADDGLLSAAVGDITRGGLGRPGPIVALALREDAVQA